jgi:hypothetical protein
MCQLNQTKPFTPVKPIRCYRVYEQRDGSERSFYGNFDPPPLNVQTTAMLDPFHAFQRLKDVEKWIAYRQGWIGFDKKIVVYRCEATGKVQKGTWDNHPIKTLTCTQLTLLKKVGKKSIEETTLTMEKK